MSLSNIRHEWLEMDGKFKAVIISLVIGGFAFIVFMSQKNAQADKIDQEKKLAQRAAQEAQTAQGAAAFNFSTLPSTNRNQGLEDLKTEIQQLKEAIQRGTTPEGSGPNRQQSGDTTPLKGDGSLAAPIDLNKSLPPPISFDQPGTQQPSKRNRVGMDVPSASPAFGGMQEPVKETPAPPQFKVWPAEKITAQPNKNKEPKGLVIPVNSALESVMLSGINAKPSGSISGAAGSVNSANDVGAPFVTRLKGDALLPNGWKLSDLGDCFLGGSGIAILSAERVYVISNIISCIAADGEVYEAPVKAYGLDADGTQGIAGKVVSKQGAILMQAAITGIASGLGSALSPSALTSSNTSAQSGSQQGIQNVNPSLVAQTSLGTGINQAAAALSRFYLEFARETFPVIEVVASTRITWILKETIEFKRTKKASLQ